MATVQLIEQVAHTPRVAVSMIDRLAQALHAGGNFPPALGDITCEIVQATAPIQRTYEPPRVLGIVSTRAGYVTLDGSYAKPGEPGREWALGPGKYLVRVRSELYLNATFELTWPPTGSDRRVRIPQPANQGNVDNLELYPSAAYPMPDLTLSRNQLGPTIVRGCALAADGTPIEGAVAEVIHLALLQPAGQPILGSWPFMRTSSAANGDWALVLPGRLYIDPAPEVPAVLPPPNSPPMTKQISVRVVYPTGTVTTLQNVVLGDEHSVRNTGLRGQVLGSGGSPIVGARITTSVSAAVSTTGRDGSWFLYFDLGQPAVANLSVTATTPSQASATDSTASVQPDAAVVVPTFHFP